MDCSSFQSSLLDKLDGCVDRASRTGRCFKQLSALEHSNRRQAKNRSVKRKVHHCDQCDYVTFYTTNLLSHKKKHTGDFIKCPLCPKLSGNKYEYTYHMKGHTGELSCGVCGKMYGSHQGLSVHKKKFKH